MTKHEHEHKHKHEHKGGGEAVTTLTLVQFRKYATLLSQPPQSATEEGMTTT